MKRLHSPIRWQDEPHSSHAQDGVGAACPRFRVGSRRLSDGEGRIESTALTLRAEGVFSAFARGWVLIGYAASAGFFVETEEGRRFEIHPEEGKNRFNFEEALPLMGRKLAEAKASDFDKEPT